MKMVWQFEDSLQFYTFASKFGKFHPYKFFFINIFEYLFAVYPL